jgi:hypothetical protein
MLSEFWIFFLFWVSSRHFLLQGQGAVLPPWDEEEGPPLWQVKPLQLWEEGVARPLLAEGVKEVNGQYLFVFLHF